MVWFLSCLALGQTSRTDIQTYTILSCFSLVHFTDVTCFTNWRQNPSPARRLQLASLRFLLYSGQSETEPTVSLRGVCISNGGMLDFKVHVLAFMPSIQDKMFISFCCCCVEHQFLMVKLIQKLLSTYSGLGWDRNKKVTAPASYHAKNTFSGTLAAQTLSEIFSNWAQDSNLTLWFNFF